MPWELRFNVAVGVAEALNYLHNECSQPVIHRDIKSSNILLSEEYQPQVCCTTHTNSRIYVRYPILYIEFGTDRPYTDQVFNNGFRSPIHLEIHYDRKLSSSVSVPHRRLADYIYIYNTRVMLDFYFFCVCI